MVLSFVTVNTQSMKSAVTIPVPRVSRDQPVTKKPQDYGHEFVEILGRRKTHPHAEHHNCLNRSVYATC